LIPNSIFVPYRMLPIFFFFFCAGNRGIRSRSIQNTILNTVVVIYSL
jgi:hypothetical protein